MLFIGSLDAMWAWWGKQFHEPKCGSGHVCRVMAWTRQQGLVPYIGFESVRGDLLVFLVINIFRRTWALQMDTATWVQILEEIVSNSHCANTPEKSNYSTSSFDKPAMMIGVCKIGWPLVLQSNSELKTVIIIWLRTTFGHQFLRKTKHENIYISWMPLHTHIYSCLYTLYIIFLSLLIQYSLVMCLEKA